MGLGVTPTTYDRIAIGSENKVRLMLGVLVAMVQLFGAAVMHYIAIALAITNPVAGVVAFGLLGLATMYVVRRAKRYLNR